MKQIRVLALFSFIIFCCPFFQHCSDKTIIENRLIKGNPAYQVASGPETAEDRKNIIYEFLSARDNMTLNGYEIGLTSLSDSSADQLFIIPIFLNILIFVFALKSKAKSLFYTSLLNIIFCLAWLSLMYFEHILEDINQVKFGFYLFVLNLIVICYLARLKIIQDKRLLFT